MEFGGAGLMTANPHLHTDGCLIEGRGVLDDGSHYTVQANLSLEKGLYVGTANCTLKESKQPWEADLNLAVTYTKGRELEIEGSWIEAENESVSIEFEFALEVQRVDE